jgi:hypothetical protein
MQIRATTGLELAAGLFTKFSSELVSQLNVSLTSDKSDSQKKSLRIGINRDVMGGMRAPIERKVICKGEWSKGVLE